MYIYKNKKLILYNLVTLQKHISGYEWSKSYIIQHIISRNIYYLLSMLR